MASTFSGLEFGGFEEWGTLSSGVQGFTGWGRRAWVLVRKTEVRVWVPWDSAKTGCASGFRVDQSLGCKSLKTDLGRRCLGLEDNSCSMRV